MHVDDVAFEGIKEVPLDNPVSGENQRRLVVFPGEPFDKLFAVDVSPTELDGANAVFSAPSHEVRRKITLEGASQNPEKEQPAEGRGNLHQILAG